MAKDPEKRPASATLFAQTLKSIAQEKQHGKIFEGVKVKADEENIKEQARKLVKEGIILNEQYQHEAAIALYSKAIQLDPNNAIAWKGKGWALNELKRYEEALTVFDQAIFLDPQNSWAYNNKGYALNGLKRYEEALEAYKKAEELDPSNSVAKSNREILEKKRSGFFGRFFRPDQKG